MEPSQPRAGCHRDTSPAMPLLVWRAGHSQGGLGAHRPFPSVPLPQLDGTDGSACAWAIRGCRRSLATHGVGVPALTQGWREGRKVWSSPQPDLRAGLFFLESSSPLPESAGREARELLGLPPAAAMLGPPRAHTVPGQRAHGWLAWGMVLGTPLHLQGPYSSARKYLLPVLHPHCSPPAFSTNTFQFFRGR